MSRTLHTLLQKAGDFTGADSGGIKSEDGLGKFQGSGSPVGEDLGMEVSLPDAGDPQVLQWPNQGKEVTGVVAVGLLVRCSSK